MAGLYKKFHWTEHSKIKMRQYGLSKQKLLGILHRPERKEKGIVPGTTAVMKTNKVFKKTLPLFKGKTQPAFASPAHPPSHEATDGHGKASDEQRKTSAWQRRAPGEIWLMYKDIKEQRKIISAWRYPGISKPGEEIPIPNDIKQELLNNDKCN